MSEQMLVGKGTSGDFVHKYQKMGTQQGFKNVSQIWLDTGCFSYDEVANRIQDGHAEIEDFRIPFKAMKPMINDEKNKLIFNHDGLEFIPTRYALSHISSMAGTSLYDTEVLAGIKPDSHSRMRNRPQDRQALLTLLNTGFSLIEPNKEFLFRTQKDGTLRAWLSNQYEIMDNLWFLEIMKDIIPGGVFSHWNEDGDFSTLWGNVLIPDTIRQESDSDYGAMYSIGNSEIGRRKLTATPSLFRAICMNGCIWDQTRGQNFQKIHRGKMDLLILRNELRKHLTKQIPLINNSIDDLLHTREIGWDGVSARPVFAALGHHFRFSKKENSNIYLSWKEQANQEDGFSKDKNLRNSAFGVINAVTRSARKTEEPGDWVKFDEIGGKLLDWKKGNWNTLFGAAKSMKSEEVTASFTNSIN